MKEERVSASPPFAGLASPSGTSMPPAFTSPRCLPPWKSRVSTLAGTRSGALLPLADGRRCCTFSSTALDPRLDPSPRRSRGRFMAACASNDFCRSMFQRARRWTARTSRTAETVAQMAAFSTDRCLSIDGDRRRCSGSGAEDHRASTFPLGIAPERDFAPTPIASDNLVSRALPAALSGVDEGDRRSRLR
jgi:hypothetical protein